MSSEELTDLKVDVAKIVMATETNTENIAALTADIKELTRDLKDSLCGKNECDDLKKRMSKAESKIETIEGIPNALMMRALMTLVAGTVMYVMYSAGISK